MDDDDEDLLVHQEFIRSLVMDELDHGVTYINPTTNLPYKNNFPMPDNFKSPHFQLFESELQSIRKLESQLITEQQKKEKQPTINDKYETDEIKNACANLESNNNKKISRAIDTLRKLSENQNPIAKYHLGVIYQVN